MGIITRNAGVALGLSWQRHVANGDWWTGVRAVPQTRGASNCPSKSGAPSLTERGGLSGVSFTQPHALFRENFWETPEKAGVPAAPRLAAHMAQPDSQAQPQPRVAQHQGGERQAVTGARVVHRADAVAPPAAAQEAFGWGVGLAKEGLGAVRSGMPMTVSSLAEAGGSTAASPCFEGRPDSGSKQGPEMIDHSRVEYLGEGVNDIEGHKAGTGAMAAHHAASSAVESDSRPTSPLPPRKGLRTGEWYPYVPTSGTPQSSPARGQGSGAKSSARRMAKEESEAEDLFGVWGHGESGQKAAGKGVLKGEKERKATKGAPGDGRVPVRREGEAGAKAPVLGRPKRKAKSEETKRLEERRRTACFALLGLDRSADLPQIRQAYRALSRRFHPDVNDDPDAAAVFLAIQQAYKIVLKTWQQQQEQQMLEGTGRPGESADAGFEPETGEAEGAVGLSSAEPAGHGRMPRSHLGQPSMKEASEEASWKEPGSRGVQGGNRMGQGPPPEAVGHGADSWDSFWEDLMTPYGEKKAEQRKGAGSASHSRKSSEGSLF